MTSGNERIDNYRYVETIYGAVIALPSPISDDQKAAKLFWSILGGLAGAMGQNARQTWDSGNPRRKPKKYRRHAERAAVESIPTFQQRLISTVLKIDNEVARNPSLYNDTKALQDICQKSFTTPTEIEVDRSEKAREELESLEVIEQQKSQPNKPKIPAQSSQLQQLPIHVKEIIFNELPKKVYSQSDNIRGQKLQEVTSKFKKFFRVKRWRTSSHYLITQFIDTLKDGTKVRKYRNCSPEETQMHRRQHYFPGLELILSNDEIRDIYFRSNDSGYCVVAQMYKKILDNKLDFLGNGKIFFGIDNNSIYHLRFTPEEELLSEEREDLNNAVPEFINNEGLADLPKKDDGWTHNSIFEFYHHEYNTLILNFLREDYFVILYPRNIEFK